MASAGNSATDSCASYYNPITTPDKLLVGATTPGGKLASFSNYGACVHVQVYEAHTFPAPLPHSCMSSRHSATAASCLCHNARPCPRPPPKRRTEPPPTVRTGPRLRCPGGVGWLKQHSDQLHQWHQHGGAACLRRRRPAARGGLDPLGGASQGYDPRRRGGGLPRPLCKRRSRKHTQPLPHRRSRSSRPPKPP